MSIATQIEGERIAKETAELTKALMELKKRRSPFTFWLNLILMAVGSGWGFLVTHPDDPLIRMTLNIATGIAFFLSVTTTVECIHLRRQLDAALVLVRKHLV